MISAALLLALNTKHLIFDFLIQPPYMWKNKGTYGHFGGILHSGIHAVATLGILIAFNITLPLAILLAFGEFIIHYHMDWFKMWYGKLKGYTATTHEEFWWWMGIDQFVHAVTYIAMVWIVLAYTT